MLLGIHAQWKPSNQAWSRRPSALLQNSLASAEVPNNLTPAFPLLIKASSDQQTIGRFLLRSESRLFILHYRRISSGAPSAPYRPGYHWRRPATPIGKATMISVAATIG